VDLATTLVTVTAGERQQICVNKVRHAFDFITTTVLFVHHLFVLLLTKSTTVVMYRTTGWIFFICCWDSVIKCINYV